MSGSGVPFGLTIDSFESFTREELILIIEGLYLLGDSDSVRKIKDKIRIRIENIDKGE